MCQKKAVQIDDISKIDKETRETIFFKAIKETTKIVKNIKEHEYSYCGDECFDLIYEGMAKQADEYFSDWLTNKNILRKLKEIPLKDDRIIFIQEAFSIFCRPEGVLKDYPELAYIEKKFSQKPHGDDRNRRLSLISPEIAKLLGCKIDKDVKKGFGACEL